MFGPNSENVEPLFVALPDACKIGICTTSVTMLTSSESEVTSLLKVFLALLWAVLVYDRQNSFKGGLSNYVGNLGYKINDWLL